MSTNPVKTGNSHLIHQAEHVERSSSSLQILESISLILRTLPPPTTTTTTGRNS
ncbi:hypothetical protein K0M31_017972, partial [Melipona bicolor]